MRKGIWAFAFTLTFGLAANADEPFKNISYKDALAVAKAENKAVLVQVGVSWSTACQELDEDLWAEEDVSKFLTEKTIPIKLDIQEEKSFLKNHRVLCLPTIMLMKADGSELDRIVGKVKKEEFLKKAGDALEGRGSLTREGSGVEEDRDPKNPKDRVRQAIKWEYDDQHEQAIEAYLWCFDRGLEFDDDFRGIWRDYVIYRLKRLAAYYRPARDAVTARRKASTKLIDEALQALKDGKEVDLEAEPIKESLHDAGALNRAYHQSAKTTDIFETMLEQGDKTLELRKLVMPYVIRDLVMDKRYKLVMGSAGDVPAMIQEKIDGLAKRLKDLEDMDEEEKEKKFGMRINTLMLVKDMRVSYAEDFCPYFEAAIAAGDKKLAKQIAEKIFALHTTLDVYEDLIDHALRVDCLPAAKWLVERGMEDDKLAYREQRILKKTARKLKKKAEKGK